MVIWDGLAAMDPKGLVIPIPVGPIPTIPELNPEGATANGLGIVGGRDSVRGIEFSILLLVVKVEVEVEVDEVDGLGRLKLLNDDNEVGNEEGAVTATATGVALASGPGAPGAAKVVVGCRPEEIGRADIDDNDDDDDDDDDDDVTLAELIADSNLKGLNAIPNFATKK